MDSRRWLVALGALALLGVATLVVDLWHRPAAEASRRILPSFHPAEVRAIRIEHPGQPDRPAVVLERPAPGAPLALTHPVAAPADPAALDDLLGTLELLSARRHDGGGLGAARLRLTITRARGPAVTLSIAAPAGVTDRVWMSRSGRGGRLLIDGYAARALDLVPDDLREARPLRRAADAHRIDVSRTGDEAPGLVLAGPPWTVHLDGGTARADAGRVAALQQHLAHLRIARFADHAALGPPAGAVRLGSDTVTLGGRCPGKAGGELVDADIGRGCLPRAEADFLAQLASQPEAYVDRHLIDVPEAELSGVTLERGGRHLTVARADAPDVVRGWLTRFSRLATGDLAPAAGFQAEGQVTLAVREAGPVRLELGRAADGRPAARRPGEPVVLILGPADRVAQLTDPSPWRFHRLDLWSEDPSSLRGAVARRGGRVVEQLVRGDTLEDWRAAVPAGAAVAEGAVDRLRRAAGFLTADRVVAARAAPAHGFGRPHRTIQLSFDPEPGADQPIQHVVELGAVAPDGGCYARADRDPVVFEVAADRCATLGGPWTVP